MPDGTITCEGLQEAPEDIEVHYYVDPARGKGDGLIRAIPGSFKVSVLNGPDLDPVPLEQVAYYRVEDGTVNIPTLPEGFSGHILVPHDGIIIRAVEQAYPLAAILVTDVPASRTRLLRVR
jgi:hypothetical protein